MVDTNLLCFELNKANNPELSWADFQALSHGNFYEALKKGTINGKKFSAHPEYHVIYGNKICDINIPPEIKEAILKLAKSYPLTVVSATSAVNISKRLKQEGLLRHFGEILGFEESTSKVVKFKKLLANHKIAGKDAVLITDTLGDILEANAVGVSSIAVSWGLHDRSTFAPGSPDAIIDEPKDLVPTIERILG